MPGELTKPRDGESDAAITVDGSGHVLEFNHEAERLLGLQPSVLGRPLSEVLVPPSLAGAAGVADLRWTLSEDSPREPDRVIELVLWHADGNAFAGELTLTRTNDTPARFIAVIRDASGWSTVQTESARRLVLLERAEHVAQIGAWEWAPKTDRLSWSSNMFRLFGLEPDEITPSVAWVIEHIHHDDRPRMERAVEGLRRDGTLAPLEFRTLPADGSTCHLRAVLTAVQKGEDGADLVIGVVRDVTAERVAENVVLAHIAVSEALVAWESLGSGATLLVRGLTEALGFAVGTLWFRRDDALVAEAIWHAPDPDLEDFEHVTRQLRLASGEGPAGEAMTARAPIDGNRARDAPSARRQSAVAAARLRGAIAFPALDRDDVVAVIELHSREPVRLSDALRRSLVAIGQELGEFLAHRRREPGHSVLTEREIEVLQLAADGCSGPEIGARLFISGSTVKTHFSNIFSKLETCDRASAVAVALRRGLIR